MDIVTAEKELVKVYNDGIAMRIQYGGSTLKIPTFPTATIKAKYDSLVARYRELEAIVGKARALSLTNSTHVSAYGYSNAVVASVGVGVLLAMVAATYFLMKRKA